MSIHEFGAASLVAFATTTFLMNITPGPAVMGRRCGSPCWV